MWLLGGRGWRAWAVILIWCFPWARGCRFATRGSRFQCSVGLNRVLALGAKQWVGLWILQVDEMSVSTCRWILQAWANTHSG
jgi:hypothetical protein